MKKTKCIKKKSICVKLKTKCIKKKNKKKCVKKTICAKRKTKCVKRHKKTHKRYSGGAKQDSQDLSALRPLKINRGKGSKALDSNIGRVFGYFNKSETNKTPLTITHSNESLEATTIRLNIIKADRFINKIKKFAIINDDIGEAGEHRTGDYEINTKINGDLIEEINTYIKEGTELNAALQDNNKSVVIANLLDFLYGFLLYIDCALSTFYFTASYQTPHTGERPGINLLPMHLRIHDSHIQKLQLITYIIKNSGPNGGNLDYYEINNITDKMIEEVGTLKIQEGLNVIYQGDTSNFSQDIIDFIYNFKQSFIPHRIIGSDNSVRKFLQDRESALQLGSVVDDDPPPPYYDDVPPPPYDDDYYTHPSH